MGGVDKGLQLFRGRPLALNAFERLKPQTDEILLSANRSEEAYRRMLPAGTKILPDLRPGFAGPLAGLEAAMATIPERERTCAWIVTVPCDCPLFPMDLVSKLNIKEHKCFGSVAMAEGVMQPSFMFVPCSYQTKLKAFLDSGSRRLRDWVEYINCEQVNFNDKRLFVNCNTLMDLDKLNKPYLPCSEQSL